MSKRSEGPIPPLFVISVEDPQKVGDPIRAHTLYTVHTRVCSHQMVYTPVSLDDLGL